MNDTPIPETDPVMMAWNDYKKSADYSNSRRWAGDEQHVDGSLWAAFWQGWIRRYRHTMTTPPEADIPLEAIEAAMRGWNKNIFGSDEKKIKNALQAALPHLGFAAGVEAAAKLAGDEAHKILNSCPISSEVAAQRALTVAHPLLDLARAIRALSPPAASRQDGARALPLDRDTLGRIVREAWVRWAKTQSSPKPNWLVPYADLPERDKEADRQIGEAVARWTLIHDAANNTAASPWRPTHLHKKRGSTYVVERSQVSVQTSRPIVEGDTITVYVASDGTPWARLDEEFNDGRFEPLPPPPKETSHD